MRSGRNARFRGCVEGADCSDYWRERRGNLWVAWRNCSARVLRSVNLSLSDLRNLPPAARGPATTYMVVSRLTPPSLYLERRNRAGHTWFTCPRRGRGRCTGYPESGTIREYGAGADMPAGIVSTGSTRQCRAGPGTVGHTSHHQSSRVQRPGLRMCQTPARST